MKRIYVIWSYLALVGIAIAASAVLYFDLSRVRENDLHSAFSNFEIRDGEIYEEESD